MPISPTVPKDADSSFLVLLEALDEPGRKRICAVCSQATLGPGLPVYRQGDPADAVYVVAYGVVEALTFSPDGTQSRLVATMEQGDLFGDLAIFTDQPRLATVRTRGAAEVWRIGKEEFLSLMTTIPELGFFLSRMLARRLHRTSMEAHHHVYGIDLTGNLERFDLLTIVQAITGMGHSGELVLNNSANELLGSFFFRRGKVEQARFGPLRGLEAIWQGFIESAAEGSFSFHSVEAPPGPVGDSDRIDMESTSLLLEGVGKRDTYQGLPMTLRQMEGSLVRVAQKLDWKNAENRALAEKIWSLIPETQPLLTIHQQLNVSAISFLEVVMEMGLNGQAELFVEESRIAE
jgi:hypothetical protein